MSKLEMVQKGKIGNFNLDFAVNVEHLVRHFYLRLLEMHNTTVRSRNSNFTVSWL
jgi:hypothetical protein